MKYSRDFSLAWCAIRTSDHNNYIWYIKRQSTYFDKHLLVINIFVVVSWWPNDFNQNTNSIKWTSKMSQANTRMILFRIPSRHLDNPSTGKKSLWDKLTPSSLKLYTAPCVHKYHEMGKAIQMTFLKASRDKFGMQSSV